MTFVLYIIFFSPSRTPKFKEVYKPTGGENNICILKFLQLICTVVDPVAKALVRSLLCSLAFLLDASPLFATSQDDALCVAPVPMGARRARRIDDNLRREVGREVGRGISGRTAGTVTATMQRFRRWKTRRFGTKPASNAVSGRVKSYIRESKNKMGGRSGRKVCVAFDGTRMGQQDVMHSAVHSVGAGLPAWAPPQVVT